MAVPHEVAHAIVLKAQGSGYTGTSHVAAVNFLAGTKNMELVGALNVIAGNPKTGYRDHDGVLNQLAGTSGWGANAAASRWAGLF